MRARVAGLLGLAALIAAVLLATGVSSATPSAAPKQLVWFSPMPASHPRPNFPDPPGSKDYMALFRRNARWHKAARRVTVFKLYEVWVTEWPTAQLRRILTDLKRRQIALGVETGSLPNQECGHGVEGFLNGSTPRQTAQAVKRAGGTIAFVAVDAPFAAGHLYDGPNACHWDPERVARELGAYVAELRRSFPRVVVGEIEPLWAGVDPQRLVDWMDTYRRVTGRHLSFFHLDLDFTRPDWAEAAHVIEQAARARGIRFGIEYYGGYKATTDAEWVAASERRTVEYEAKEGGRPDHVVLQSWEALPDYLLPEAKPSTFTWLINRYFRPRTRLTLQVSGATAAGSLAAGRNPLAGRSIEVTATPLDGPGAYVEYTLSGTVPADAVVADVGYRVNTECACSGEADFTLHEVRYQEAGGPNRVPNPRFDQGLEGWGLWGEGQAQLEPSGGSGQALHVTAARGQAAAINSASFLVSPGARFTVTFAARVSPASAGSGYFDVIFLRNDTEGTRRTVDLEAAPIVVGSLTTGTRGAFTAELGALPPGSHLLEAWFRGGSKLFPSYASARITR